MRISSALQSELNFGEPVQNTTTFMDVPMAGDVNVLGAPVFQPPERVEAARIAGRMNAASTSSFEMNALLAERATLLDKKFNGSITKREENRLELVRWELDRIEDARFGFELDQLESMTKQYESLLSSLRNLGQQISEQTKANRGKKTKRARERRG